MNRENCIRALRAMAEFLETHPELPAPFNVGSVFYAFVTKEELPHLLHQASFKKEPCGDFFSFSYHVCPGLSYELAIEREELCERVLVGTKKVTKYVYPDKVTVGSETVKVRALATEVEEPVYEWKCPESILKMSD